MNFVVAGDDAEALFPVCICYDRIGISNSVSLQVSVSFIGQGSLLGVAVKKVGHVSNEGQFLFTMLGQQANNATLPDVSEDIPYSVDSILSVDEYSVV